MQLSRSILPGLLLTLAMLNCPRAGADSESLFALIQARLELMQAAALYQAEHGVAVADLAAANPGIQSTE